MKTLLAIGILGGSAALLSLTGCKTEINNPPASNGTTVIHEDRGVHDVNPNPPPVQNNIKVDR